MKLYMVPDIWTPKTGWVSCCAQTWQALTNWPPLLIGKATRPATLNRKGIVLSQLKVNYYHNSNGWMTSVVFEHWLDQWSERLAKQRWHILLLIDNAPSHITKEYSNIRVQFLPPNKISKLQPLNQVIIQVCKMQYPTLLNTKLCKIMDTKNKKHLQKVMKGFNFDSLWEYCWCMGVYYSIAH